MKIIYLIIASNVELNTNYVMMNHTMTIWLEDLIKNYLFWLDIVVCNRLILLSNS